MFGGGFNVGVNINAEHIVYNDINTPVVNLLNYLSLNETENLINEIDEIINKFSLTKENQDGFNKLRSYYNEENNSEMVFYTMICYAFNYQIRFNKDGKYNMPFGKNRSSFNPTLRKKFIEFCDRLHNIDIVFMNKHFDYFNKEIINDFDENDLFYCDPPYLNSVATYNEQSGWTNVEEKKLLDLLDELNERNIRFALSNNLKYGNELLEEWMKKYKVFHLSGDYTNCNYQKIDRSKDDEVLIVNY